MIQPKVGQKFRIKNDNRIFKCESDDDLSDRYSICKNCVFHYEYICVNLKCKENKCHYIEVPNVKTKK